MATNSNSYLQFRNTVESIRFRRFVQWANGDTYTATDLLQDANLKAFKSYGNSEELWLNNALLKTVDKSVLCNWLRDQKRRHVAFTFSLDDSDETGLAEECQAIVGCESDVETIAFRQALQQAVRAELARISARLTDRQRQILTNWFTPVKELARNLDTTTRSIISQRNKLSERLRNNPRLRRLALDLNY